MGLCLLAPPPFFAIAPFAPLVLASWHFPHATFWIFQTKTSLLAIGPFKVEKVTSNRVGVGEVVRWSQVHATLAAVALLVGYWFWFWKVKVTKSLDPNVGSSERDSQFVRVWVYVIIYESPEKAMWPWMHESKEDFGFLFSLCLFNLRQPK